MPTFQERYGPWALVTGASSGIGAEFARQLAARGLNLVLVARRKERLETLARQLIERHRIQAHAIAVDLSQPDFMSSLRAVTDALEIGLLVNNAGFALTGRFLDNELERELSLLNVNCRAPLILAHEFGRKMVARGRGGIIFVSSVMAHISSPYWTSYSASKAWNLLVGEALCYELKTYGVDVLALCPGGTNTEFKNVAGIQGNYPQMPVEPVVASALRALGRKPSLIAGLQNRATYLFMKLLPRRWITRVWTVTAERLVKDKLANAP